MTDRETMQMALEALEGWDNHGKWAWPDTALEQSKRNTTESLASLRAALEQQAEPVHGDIRALKYRIHELEGEVLGYKRMLDVAEAQPKRKPLTEEEIKEAVLDDPIGGAVLLGLMRNEVMVTQLRQAINLIARAIEAAHGIKGEE